MSLVLRAERYAATLGRDGRQMMLLLAAVACIALPLFAHLPVWATLAAATAFSAKVWLLRRHRGAPDRWLLALITVALSGATLLQFRTLFGRDAGVTLLVMLICVKLLELRARRDTFVVICLGFFLALCQFLYSQSIPTAALVLVGVIALLTAQVAQHLEGDPAVDAPPTMRAAFGIALRLFGFAVPLTLVVFVLFPRASGPLWGTPGDGIAGTGLSNTMAPGSITTLVESDALAFRARFDADPPPASARYFRALVLGDFDGRTWRTLDPQRQQTQPVTVRPLTASIGYTVTQEPFGQPWLYVLDAPTAAPRLVGASVGTMVLATPEATYLTQYPQYARLLVRAESATAYRLAPAESEAPLDRWTLLPPGYNPRTLEFAKSLRDETGDTRRLVQRILTLFHDQPFRYTLSPPALGRDSVDEFLFDTRAGFCEHYASAFVVLMRALGLPARVVTGYQGGEINSVDGTLEVRQRDAHAWAEVWLGAEAGWIRVDPTAAVAPERVERGSAATFPRPAFAGVFTIASDYAIVAAMRALRDRWNATENAWNLWVLQYNAGAQRGLLQRLGFEEPDWHHLVLAMTAAVGMLSALLVARLLWKRPRRDPLQHAWIRFESRLAGAGLVRAPHEAPLALAARFDRELDGPSARSARRILDAYVVLRYRPAQPRPAFSFPEFHRWISDFRPSPRS